MSSFALLRSNGSAPIDTERVDLNIWVLPSLFRRHVYLCDIGICCSLEEDVIAQPIEFELRVPFLPDDGNPTDLMPRMRSSEMLCSLVFGNSDLRLKRDDNGTWVSDDDGPLLLTDLPDIRRQTAPGPETRSASWMISTGPMTLPAKTRLYLRLRTTTHSPNRMWTWQTGNRRNSYALCDLRFNEFRENGENNFPAYFSRVINPHKINGFLIISAQYREVRASPAPEYIRVLEGDAWAKYLGRRLSRSGEPFLVTYWKDVSISPAHPYRAFMEVERRRTTIARNIVITTCVLLLVIIFTQPSSSLMQSPAGAMIRQVESCWPVVAGGFSLGAVWATVKVIMACIASGYLRRVRQLLVRIERRWYQIR